MSNLIDLSLMVLTQHFGRLRELPLRSVTEGELFPPNPVSFVQRCFGSGVKDYYHLITDTKSYYDRLPQMPVARTDIVLSSATQKYEHGHFILKASDEVNSLLELLRSKQELWLNKSFLTTALPRTSNFEEELQKKYADISETILRLEHEQLIEFIREVLEDILSSVVVSDYLTPVDSVLASTTESCPSVSQLTETGDYSFVTVGSRGSVTPADDVIIKDLLSEEKMRNGNEGVAQNLNRRSSAIEENLVTQVIVQKPPRCDSKVNAIGRTLHRRTKEFDETKLFTDYANNPWQDPFNWFMGNYKSEIQYELLYCPKTSEQFSEKIKSSGDSVMIVQNWIALDEDWILSWELGHQVTVHGMPDNSGPDILLGPEAGVYIIMTEPQGGVAAALLAWRSAAQDSCLRVWVICVGDLSLYMEALVIARHPFHKENEMQMTPLFVPDTDTMTSTIVELGKFDWRAKVDIREDLTTHEQFLVDSFKSVNHYSARLILTQTDLKEFMWASEDIFNQFAWMSRSLAERILEERRGVKKIYDT